jgi:hypothetical protein
MKITNSMMYKKNVLQSIKELKKSTGEYSDAYRQIFVLMKWYWSDEEGGAYVPSKQEINSALDRMLDELRKSIYKHPNSQLAISTGRVVVYYNPHDHDLTEIGYTLEFGDEKNISGLKEV